VKRLLFVGTNRGPGGTESHFVDLATAMAAAGHRVAAVVRPDDVIWRALAENGCVELFPLCFEGSMDVATTVALGRICRAWHPQWLIGTFAHEYGALAAVARTQRVPLVLFKHVRRMRRVTARVVSRLARLLILPSEYLREWAVQRGVPRSRAAVLYNPVDTSRFHVTGRLKREMRLQLALPDDAVVVGFVGRYEEQKGVLALERVLTSLMARHPQLHALWVGGGALEPELRARTEQSLHAHRHLHQPWTSDIVRWYAAMDILAFPSMRREAFGRVSIEAQSCGLPVLASRVGGIPETMIDGTTGLLVPPGDDDAWTSALHLLLTDGLLRRRMGQAGRHFVRERFDFPCIATEFERLLDSVDRRRPSVVPRTVSSAKRALAEGRG
jgi:glycosyltransferase involved in cell wall biosynthesis